MPKALLLLHPGCEEIESITPIDLLRRAGITVVSASVTEDLKITGGRGIPLIADTLLSDCTGQSFDMLILPGGPGVDALRKRPEVLALAQKFHREEKWIAAICAAPLVLLDAGILPNHVVTSFPSAEQELREKALTYSLDRVHVDGKLITSRGAGTSEEFSLKLIEVLLDLETSQQVRQRILGR